MEVANRRVPRHIQASSSSPAHSFESSSSIFVLTITNTSCHAMPCTKGAVAAARGGQVTVTAPKRIIKSKRSKRERKKKKKKPETDLSSFFFRSRNNSFLTAYSTID